MKRNRNTKYTLFNKNLKASLHSLQGISTQSLIVHGYGVITQYKTKIFFKMKRREENYEPKNKESSKLELCREKQKPSWVVAIESVEHKKKKKPEWMLSQNEKLKCAASSSRGHIRPSTKTPV